MPMTAPILEASKISKRYGPVIALQEVDFRVERGEIHALLGINGAGKSTFIKILSGLIQKDRGVLRIDGHRVDFRASIDAIAAGIATVQQHPELAPDMSGLDNIFLGREHRARGLWRRIDRAALAERAARLMARFAVALDLDQRVAHMSAVEREVVAILQALAGEDIKILILDEPTSTLTDVERADLFKLMRQLRRQGISIIYITHQLEEVFEIADSFSVFRNGALVARMGATEARERRLSLATLVLGEAIDGVFPDRATPPAPGETVLSLRGFTRPGAFEAVTLKARRGEVLGIFGLVGSGAEELAKAIFGAVPVADGELRLNGERLRPKNPAQALKAGIFLVPGERRLEGLALDRSPLFNVPLANLQRASAGRWALRHRRIAADAGELTAGVDLYPPALDLAARNFSGGNQQKIVLAKGLYSKADLYIFVEPTVGVDIGARARIYALIRELGAQAAVIVVSSDCDEVHGVADRALAMHKGRQVTPGADGFSRDALLLAGLTGGGESP